MSDLKLYREIEKLLSKNYRRKCNCLKLKKGLQVDFLINDDKFTCFKIVTLKNELPKTLNLGHYNYYVMPINLYKEVKRSIPKHIGVLTIDDDRKRFTLTKSPTEHTPTIEELSILNKALNRSLSREMNKYYNLQQKNTVPQLHKKITQLSQDGNRCYEKYKKSSNDLFFLQNDLELIHGEGYRNIIKTKADKIRKKQNKEFSSFLKMT